MQSRGFSVQILCGRSSLPDKETESVDVVEWSSMFERTPLKMLFGKATRIIEDFQPQIIHVMGQDIGYTGYRLLTSSPLPFVMTAFPPIRAYRAFGRLSRAASAILAWSEDAREELVNDLGCPKHKVAIVPPGIDVNSYAPSYPFSSDRPPTVGVAGTISGGSGFDLFLDAAALILKECGQVNFIVAGDGGAEQKLRSIAIDKGIAGAVSFVQRAASYRQPMECMDIFVQPSIVDLFPSTLLEAMALGKAVVAGGVGGVYSLIADGRTGAIVNRGDSAAIAKAVTELIKNPDKARRMGIDARDDVVRRFNMENKLDRLVPVYEKILKADSKRAAASG